MSDVEFWNTIISVVSLIVGVLLSILAIFISLYFYNEGKKTETTVSTMLAEIRQQTGALERLTGKLLDRLTRAVTDSAKPEHEERRLLLMFQAFRGVVPAASQQMPEQLTPEQREMFVAVVCYC